jgi:hypothetical protein
MKTARISFLGSILIVFITIATNVSSQTIQVNTMFSNDSIIYPFIGYSKIYSLKINGTVKLHSDTSLLRVNMIDQYGNSFLAFEAYPLITIEDTFYIQAGCEETCFIDGITPISIRIELINSTLVLNTIIVDTNYIKDAAILQEQSKAINDSLKVDILNHEIQKYKLYWRAGITCFQSWTHQEKEKRFGEKYNLFGYDYYKRGLFTRPAKKIYSKATNDFVSSFNWRFRHSADIPGTPYYDGEPESSFHTGWVTPVEDQGECGTCWVFGSTGAVETRINLYFNFHDKNNPYHIDYNISEQDVWKCGTGNNTPCNLGGSTSMAYSRMKFNYKCTSDYYPYNPNANDICQKPGNPGNEIKIENYTYFGLVPLSLGEQMLKHKLINYGPLTAGIPNFNGGNESHEVTIIGYETVKSGMKVFVDKTHQMPDISIDEESDLIGSTICNFKNSWGTSWGDNGFGLIPIDEISGCDYAFGNIFWEGHNQDPNSQSTSIICSDEDGDGYYWWGISQTTPCASCPPGISQQEDCDDSNRDFGPYDATYACSDNCEAFDQSLTLPIGITNILSDEHQKKHVIVPPNATLNVSSSIYMASGRKITVKKGGKLVITATGKITSACTQLWQGIEVEGTNLTQTTSNQGYIEIQTGGIIENAICAIKTVPELLQQESGGIIKATGGVFRNNRTALHIRNYSGNITNPFTNCIFETEGELIDGSTPIDFVKLENLSSASCVKFQGCAFTETDNLRKVTGIRAYNSYFQSIKNGSTPTLFSNLLYGIYGSSGYSPAAAIVVNECQFENTYRSIYLSGCEVSQITSNAIIVPNINTHWMPVEGYTAYGIYLDQSTAYKIEDNDISCDNYGDQIPGYINTCGIYVRNSGGEANEIYLNSFNNLRCGIASFGINRNGINTGLNLKCNTYSGCGTDIGVYRGTLPLTANTGIRRDQGDFNTTNAAKSAGNVFSSLSFQYHTNDINNVTCMPIRYNHHRTQSIPPNLRMIPVPLMSPGVEIHNNDGSAFSSTLSCPSNPGKSGGDGIMLVQKTDSLKTEIDNLEATLQQNIDGGSTAETAEDVFYSTLDETYSVYSDLMEKSPYLSDTVMKNAVMREDLLPEVMLRDILVANPQAAKSDTLYNALESRVVPLNDTLMGDIMANAEVYGEKELLEMQMAEVEQQYGLIVNQRIANIISDTTVLQKTDSLITVYAFSNRLTDKYSLSLLHSDQGNLNSSAIIMGEIANEFYLTNYRQEEYNQYQAWISIVNRANSNNHNLTFDSIQVNNLQAMLAIDSLNLFLPTVLARNVLVNEGILDYSEPLIFDSELKSANVHKQYPKLTSALDAKAYLHIYPNPAKEYVIAHFRLASGCSKGVIRICQSDGKQIASIPVNCKVEELIIPLISNSNGQFLFSLYSCERFVDSQKVIVKK